MKKLIAAFLMMAGMVGCKNSAPAPSLTVSNAPFTAAPVKAEPCDYSAMETVTLHKLHGELEHYHYGSTVTELKVLQAKVGRLRKWADGLQDRCVRQSYMDWLDYFDKDIQDDMHEAYEQERATKLERSGRVSSIPNSAK